ncbi:MarR family winged helix-turn-helix transcriptional regulator [Mycolicibacterium sp. CH28]|uniref:MarR family winged helix-turn-helix transcriptional regulator n=1 Tax=Mycolicibacterium sp. CH28 TaxID=2512237 RepID=UPI001386CCEF|nr:MarR family transcriptional regulator [Mycolicibacterium sp. CH28]
MDRRDADRLHALFMDLVRVAGLIRPDQEIPGFPISMSQAFAVHELDADVPLSQRELADRLRLEKSTVSRMAADLEALGLVERERDPANRRTNRLRLTGEGRALHVRIAANYVEQFRQWAAGLSDTEAAALLVGLPALIRVVREAAPQSPPSISSS